MKFNILATRVTKVLCPAILILFCNNSLSEPSPLVSKTMNTEVSSFSFGLYKIEVKLERFFEKIDGLIPYVNYDWDTNTIEIKAAILNKCGTEKMRCEDYLKSIITITKKQFCSQLAGEKPCSLIDQIPEIFSPIGYTRQNFYKNQDSATAMKEISNIVTYSASGASNGRQVKCLSKHLEFEIYCTTK